MRTENSIRNSAFALGGQFVSLLTGFIMRTVFVHTLGDDYLGAQRPVHQHPFHAVPDRAGAGNRRQLRPV